MGKDYVTVKVTRDVYEDILKAKAYMELQTGKRKTMNDAVRGLIEYSPISYGVIEEEPVELNDKNEE